MEQSFLTVAEKIFVMFALTMTGYLCGKLKLIDTVGETVLVNLSLLIATPSVVVMSFQRDFDRSLLSGFLLTAAVVAGLFIMNILASNIFIRTEAPRRSSVLKFAAIFFNCGYISLPLAQSIYGAEGVFYTAASIGIFNIYLWTYGYYLMSGGDGKMKIRSILLNPGTVSLAIGLALFFTSTKLPGPISSIGSSLAALHTPLGMFAIGSRLSRSNVRTLFKEKGIWTSTVLRLLVLPLVTILLLALFDLRGVAAVVCVMISAAPAALATTMFAVRFHQDEELSAKVVSVQTILSLVTIPVFIYFAQVYLG